MNFKAQLKFSKVHKPQSNCHKERLLKSQKIMNVNDIIIFHFHKKNCFNLNMVQTYNNLI